MSRFFRAAARFLAPGVMTAAFFVSCVGLRGGASAEEYYAIGMAYFEIGKYEEAEKWLNRARAVDKTKVASEYNLGRIAFETGRYTEALQYFDRILKKDPQNVMALKAAAYTRIKTGELEAAEELYAQVLTLIPESADDGYNYALLLFALEKQAEAETVLLKYTYTLEENSDAILLLARAQNAQDKVEALDHYAAWLQNNNDVKVRYEYAQLLEKEAFYARALEEYRSILTGLPQESTGGASPGNEQARSKQPERSAVRFAIARLLLTADPESEEGITELGQAVAEGFIDTEAMESLLELEGIGAARKDEIRKFINDIKNAQEAEERKKEEAQKEEEEQKKQEAQPSETDVQSGANSPNK